jgi:hypothetical protein
VLLTDEPSGLMSPALKLESIGPGGRFFQSAMIAGSSCTSGCLGSADA